MTEDDESRVLALTRLGQLRSSLRRYSAARSAYESALDTLRRRGDSCEGVKLDYLLAGLEPAGRLRREALRSTGEEAERCGNRDYVRRAINRLAVECRLEGLYLEEKRCLDKLLTEQERGGSAEGSFRLRLRLADWNRRMGRLEQAREQIEGLLEGLRGQGDQAGLAVALMQLGVIDIDGGTPMRARRRLVEAGAAASGSDYPRWKRDASVLAALALLRAGRTEEALGEFDALSGSLGEVADLAAVELYLYRGEALRDLGRLGEAIVSFRRAVELSGESRNKELGWETLAALASALREQGNLSEARERARRAVELIEELRGGVAGNKPGELTHFLHLRSDAYTVYALASAELGAGRLEEAFGVVESSHARVLRESLAVDTGSASPSPALSLEALRRRLLPGETLLEYQLGERASLLLAADRDGAAIYPLPSRPELEQLTEEYLALLRAPLTRVVPEGSAAPDPDELAGRGGRLFRELLGPVADRLARASRLIIVPDRNLYRLPFGALPLPGKEGGPTRFLGTQIAVSYLPAASLCQGARDHPYQRLVAVAASNAWPEYGLPRLEHAGEEAAEVAALYPPAKRRILGEEGGAGVDDLLSALAARPDLLHLAAHAVAVPHQGPRVLVGRDPRSGRAEVLDTHAVAGLSEAPRLVILSSCDTAGGDVLGGEGVLGLVRAFTMAGSRDIVASVWPVEDESAETLMIAFHRGLRRGESPSRALLEARRVVSEESGGHPYYWAGFVVYGPD